jgi:GNAT superfamily N-acetyltransferase
MSRRAAAGPPGGRAPPEEQRYLADDPVLVSTIANWHHETWAHLTGRTHEERIREFDEQLGSERIPLTVVAFVAGRPVGSASLLTQDMDTHPDWTPWLASVFVLPEFRRRGIGERLCRRIVAEARRLGVPRLYLFTPDQAPFYARMGWRTLCREPYRGEDVTIMCREPG